MTNVNLLKDKVIILTGSTGFLGSHLATHFLDKGCKIIAIKRRSSPLWRLADKLKEIIFYDIEDMDLVQVFAQHKPDLVLHCATTYGTQIESITGLIDSNLILPLRLLEAISSYKSIPFINTDTILDRRINAYSLSKKQFLEWLQFYSDCFPCVNIELEHFYGPLDNRSKFCTKIILDLINKVDKIDLTLGQQKRDFIYIDDVINAFEKVILYSMPTTRGFHHFQLGTGIYTPIRDFVLLIKELVQNDKTQLNFGALPYRANEIMEFPLDLSALYALGWKPHYVLKEGLLKTIQFEQKFLQKEQTLCCV